MRLFSLNKIVTLLLIGLLASFHGYAVGLSAGTISAQPGLVQAGLFFDGETVTVSGQHPPGQPLLLLVVGPQQNQQIAPLGNRNGIWLKGDAHTLLHAPKFLAVASSQPLTELVGLFSDSLTAAGFNSIPEYLPLAQQRNSDPAPAENQNWHRAYATLLDRQSLLLTDLALQNNAVSGAFSTDIHLLSNAPPGSYQVIAFTQGSGQPMVLTTGFELTKSGIVSRLERTAFDQPVFYGVAALLFALLVGWVIGVLFNRR